jgi:hypothetical protein
LTDEVNAMPKVIDVSGMRSHDSRVLDLSAGSFPTLGREFDSHRRSINSDDSVDLTQLKTEKQQWSVLVGREVRSIGGNGDLDAWSRQFDSGDRIATVVHTPLAFL